MTSFDLLTAYQMLTRGSAFSFSRIRVCSHTFLPPLATTRLTMVVQILARWQQAHGADLQSYCYCVCWLTVAGAGTLESSSSSVRCFRCHDWFVAEKMERRFVLMLEARTGCWSTVACRFVVEKMVQGWVFFFFREVLLLRQGDVLNLVLFRLRNGGYGFRCCSKDRSRSRLRGEDDGCGSGARWNELLWWRCWMR